MKAYAGIGSRETPTAVQEQMRYIASSLGRQGWTLRSGAADGADWAFEIGARDIGTFGKPLPEIYLPWQGFNGSDSPLFEVEDAFARVIAARHHPAWATLSQSARKMHTRNVHQVLGPGCNTPSKFVLCWTKGGKGKGGTGQAIRIAQAHGIPVYDMATYDLSYIQRKLSEKFGVTI